jgi:hypothetical protein
VESVLAIGSLDVLGSSGRGGRTAAFLVLLGFVVSFLFIRMSTRMIRAQVSWWPGNIETESGLHLHHLVWGIALMLVSGFVGFALHTPSSPWYPIAAVLFGVGVGLTFDEFALWLHLKDVYWTEQGRSSLDAVVLVTAFMTLVVLGTKPFGLKGNEAPVIVLVIIVQALLLSVISFLKGRIALGALSVFIPGLGLWGACRLGKPDSPWGRRRYSAAKLQRAHARFPPDSRGRRFRNAFFNAIGGKPSEPVPPQAHS